MRRRLYYKAVKSLEIESTPFIIPRHSLLTPYEVKLHRLQKYVASGDLLEYIAKNGVEDYYGFRFEKEGEK